MTTQEWYMRTTEVIANSLENFYSKFYKNTNTMDASKNNIKLERAGNGFRLQPCPWCGHNDCCSVSEEYGVHCFSCDTSGSHILAWQDYAISKLYLRPRDAIEKLDEFTGLHYPEEEQYQSVEDYKADAVRRKILSVAEDFYHKQLMECKQKFVYKDEIMTPLEYMLNVRKHKIDTIKAFHVGFATNYVDLHKKLLGMGFTKEQIKLCKVWIPENLFVFFYHDPITYEILRINTKNRFSIRRKNEDKTEGEVIKGYSVGNKVPLYSPKFSFKKPFVVVEGEEDILSVYENGERNVACIGGKPEDEAFGKWFSQSESTLYTMFDNDEVGEKYTEEMNTQLPDKDIRKIKYDGSNDPDDYYRSYSPSHMSILESSAELLETDGYKISHDKRIWNITNRRKRIEFEIDQRSSEKGSIIGTVNLYINGELTDREVDKDLTKCKANKKPYNFYLHDAINVYFNSDIDKRNADELMDIYWISSRKQEIIKRLAKLLYESNNDDKFVNKLKIKLRTSDGREDVIDAILKETNDIQNKKMAGNNISNIPKIKISQYFNIENNEGYFYFMNYREDGESLRRLPYLLKNDKTLIRLDLLKRKDPQCLLLVDNKYELPVEVPEAIMDSDECSLVQEMVYKYIDGDIPKEDLDPKNLIELLTAYFKRFYYTTDESIYKMLSLYTMLTYYYEIFDSIPYLYLNGQKGSGKTVIGSALHLFCFDAKMASEISDASLFRMTSLEGGTLILDEMEQLTSRKKGMESTMGVVLKGGYKRASNVYRADVESALRTNRYDSYGPKVIINIMGLDDIIKDRCIQISSFRYKITKENRKEDPKSYLNKLSAIRKITSRLCLSALENFKRVDEIRKECFFETNDTRARLSEILTPLLVIARFVDEKERIAMKKNGEENPIGTYERAVNDFYFNVIQGDKEDTERNTPEGILTTCIPQIARELYGLVPPNKCLYTEPSAHKYNEAIPFSKEGGWFELNLIHLKCFIEEHMPGDSVYTKMVSKWLQTCYKFDTKDISRTTATVTNEELLKEFKGNEKPKVNKYRFYFKDFINIATADDLLKDPLDRDEEKIELMEKAEETKNVVQGRKANKLF